MYVRGLYTEEAIYTQGRGALHSIEYGILVCTLHAVLRGVHMRSGGGGGGGFYQEFTIRKL